jgi:type IV secretion system protein VirB2
MKKRVHFDKPDVPLTDASFGRDGIAPCRVNTLPAAFAAWLSSVPGLALAQSSPFMTGATALQTNILAWLTPIAIILVMVLGAMAMAARMSWGWCIGAILGIAMAFGAPQIVTWVRGMFGV